MGGLPFDVENLIAAVGLGAARTLPVAWLVPAFGGPNVPPPVRMAIGLALAVLCLPQLFGQVPPLSAPLWVLLIAREAAVGLTLGFVAASIFRAAEMAGRLVDTLRGANMAEVLSPVSEGRTSPLGDLNLLLAVVIFLEIGGLGHVATALARSYEAVPIAGATTPGQLARVAHLVLLSSAQMLESALGLAAPAVVALLLADLALGAIGRVAPQMPLYFVGMPAKAVLGVGVVLVALGATHAALVDGFRGWRVWLEHGIGVWR